MKTTCFIYGPGNSSDECKVLGYFGSKYANSRPTNDHGNDTADIRKFNRHQDKNAIFKQAVYEIHLQENNKVSAKEEAHENNESDFD